MSSVRNWAAGSAIAALILFSPIVAFLMVIVAEIQIDLLMEAGATADCTIAAGAIGWALWRKYGAQLEARQSGAEGAPEEAAIAAPPM
jgi:hypothetical protein